MTSHLHLVKKKQTSTPASSLLEGIWKRKPRQTSNAGNESNWEKVCPGSEGCEEVVEGTVVVPKWQGNGGSSSFTGQKV